MRLNFIICPFNSFLCKRRITPWWHLGFASLNSCWAACDTSSWICSLLSAGGRGLFHWERKYYLGYFPSFTLAPVQSNQQRAARWGFKKQSPIMALLCSKTVSSFLFYLELKKKKKTSLHHGLLGPAWPRPCPSLASFPNLCSSLKMPLPYYIRMLLPHLRAFVLAAPPSGTLFSTDVHATLSFTSFSSLLRVTSSERLLLTTTKPRTSLLFIFLFCLFPLTWSPPAITI